MYKKIEIYLLKKKKKQKDRDSINIGMESLFMRPNAQQQSTLLPTK